MSHTVNTPADLMPAQAAPAPCFVLRVAGRSIHCDSLGGLFAAAPLFFGSYMVELFEDGSAMVYEMPSVPDLAPGVYPLPLAA